MVLLYPSNRTSKPCMYCKGSLFIRTRGTSGGNNSVGVVSKSCDDHVTLPGISDTGRTLREDPMTISKSA